MLYLRAVRKTQAAVILILTAPLWIPLAAAYLTASGLLRVALHVAAWLRWRRLVLFVHSDSPNWKQTVEASILPRLPEGAAILNWSERAKWRPWSLRVLLFRAFAGDREHTPIALVIPRFRWVRRYRFFAAFKDLKHGRPETLARVAEQLFSDLELDA